MEICLCDVQLPQFGGLHDEFILSGRLDNQAMSFCALTALIESSMEQDLRHRGNITMISLFDHVEIGSKSAYGADSLLLGSTLKRIHEILVDVNKAKDAFEVACQCSYIISADMAHAVHPNYADRHEDDHRPKMNGGVVIKYNASQRYATTAPTALALQQLAKQHHVPIQNYVVRNDSSCGSTIGPIVSSSLGIRTIDVGMAQLSMHSIREMSGTEDVGYAVTLFKAFFKEFPQVDCKICVD